MNRRNFFEWLTAAIGWLVVGKEPQWNIQKIEPSAADAKYMAFTKEWQGQGKPDSVSKWNKLSLEVKPLIGQIYLTPEYHADSVITWSLKDLE